MVGCNFSCQTSVSQKPVDTDHHRQKGDVMGKEQAKDYFNRISDGHRNAIKRPWDKVTDRSLRAMIEKANRNGDCIINVGDGIFRPIPGDPVDEAALNKYLAKELHRVRAVQLKRLCMKQTFEGWKNCATP